MKILVDDLGCYFIMDGKIFRSGCFSFKEGDTLTNEQLNKFSSTKIRLKDNDLGEKKTEKKVLKSMVKKKTHL